MGVTASVWGCGDDDTATGGAGGKGGSAGKGGSSGTAGTSGKGGGGSGGATGGSGGSSGKGGGGTAGSTGGKAGTGGISGGGAGGTTGGTAGTMPGGMGGEGGEPMGGMGGEGGSGGDPLAEACATICADQVALSCTLGSACETSCVGLATDTLAPTEYLDMINCQAQNLGASDYECVNQTINDMDMIAPLGNGACETEVCAWTCYDATFVEENTYGRCGC